MNRRVFQKNNYFFGVDLGNTVFLEGTRFSDSKKSKSLNNRISLQPNSCHIRPHPSKGNDTIAVGYNLPINCLCAVKSTTKQLQMGCTFAKLPGMPRLSSEYVFTRIHEISNLGQTNLPNPQDGMIKNNVSGLEIPL